MHEGLEIRSMTAGRCPRRETKIRWPSPRAVAALALILAGLTLAGQSVYIHAKAVLGQILLERAFKQSLASRVPIKPWSWADTWPVARISVPRLGAEAIVLAGSSGQALAFGPGHVEGTPHAGESGLAVYAAHRDTHFAFLKKIVAGDVVVVALADGRTTRFRVTHTSVVAWDASGLEASARGRGLVLATCWPFEAATPGPLRYLVHATIDADGRQF